MMYHRSGLSRPYHLHPWNILIFIVSSPLGKLSICAFNCSYSQSLQFNFFGSTRYPSLLGMQKQYGLESCPTLLHMASSGYQTPDLLTLNPMPYPLGQMLKCFTKYGGNVLVHFNKTLTAKKNINMIRSASFVSLNIFNSCDKDSAWHNM